MRLPALRSASLLVVLVAALFLHGALASLLACSASPQDRPVVLIAAAEPQADPGPEPVLQPPCTHHQPCQHAPKDGRDGGDVAVRGSGVPRDGAPCLPVVCPAVEPAGSPAAGPSVSNPVPPLAVRAPVAVLGVDRN